MLVDTPSTNTMDILPDIEKYLQENPNQSLSMSGPIYTPIFDSTNLTQNGTDQMNNATYNISGLNQQL